MKRVAVVAALVIGASLMTAAPASAHRLETRGGNVISCNAYGIRVFSTTQQHSLRVKGRIRIGNNSHVYSYPYFAELHLWTSVAHRYVQVSGTIGAFNYRVHHFTKFIAATDPNATVHWRVTRCYVT
jgi:hypothetical protein